MLNSESEQKVTETFVETPLSVETSLSTDQSHDSNKINNAQKKLSNEILTKKRKNESKEDDTFTSRLLYHTNYRDIFELQKFIRELNDEIIFENHKKAMHHTRTNTGLTNPSACGITAQSILNILVENQGLTIKDTTYQDTFDSNLIGDHNIIHVGISSCYCCENFPGRAFIIYCSNNMCAVIQSYVNVYTHRDFFDVMTTQKVIKCINSFQTMCKHGVNPHAIKQLSKITHVDHTNMLSCQLRGTEFRIRHLKSNTKFSI